MVVWWVWTVGAERNKAETDKGNITYMRGTNCRIGLNLENCTMISVVMICHLNYFFLCGGICKKKKGTTYMENMVGFCE